MSLEEKEIEAVYRQRGEAWMLAMAFAKLAGYEVGVREPGEWPVHAIYLPGIGEVALHMKKDDAEACILDQEYNRVYDGHTNADKEHRIREFVRKVFVQDDTDISQSQ